jgi:four helix bundle protein
MQSFRKLDIWRRAHAHAINIRRITRSFPREFTGQRSQILKAAESVPYNIIEGCGADSRKEFSRFIGISIKSSMELEGELQSSRDSGALAFRHWKDLTRETIEIRKMLCGFRNALHEADERDRLEQQQQRKARRNLARRVKTRQPAGLKTDKTDHTADSQTQDPFSPPRALHP